VQYKTSNNKRLLVELSLIRISSIEHQMAEKKSPKSFVVSENHEKVDVSAQSTHKIVEKKDETLENPKKAEDSTRIEKEDFAPKPISRISLSAKKKSKIISISAAFDQLNHKKEEEIDASKLRKNDFSATQMLKTWKEVIAFVKQKGKSNLGITLEIFPPELKEDFVIELPLSNSSQAEMLIEEKYMILEFLRDKLENDYIEITTKVIEAEKSNIPYTNKDKFAKMMDENPHLETLRLKLGLDPDY
jgi:DNA polymerase-3 subunit gamma/tau